MVSKFDLRVVVMIRHPAAFAYSLKRKNWTFPFDDLLTQTKLIGRHLNPFRNKIEKFAARPQPIISQATLLWKIIYHTVSIFLETHPDWIVVRHEDLARNPIEGFQELYKKVGLSYTEPCRQAVINSCRPENPTEPQGTAKDVMRDSRNLVGRWREGLSTSEIKTIRAETEGVSDIWYDPSEW